MFNRRRSSLPDTHELVEMLLNFPGEPLILVGEALCLGVQQGACGVVAENRDVLVAQVSDRLGFSGGRVEAGLDQPLLRQGQPDTELR